MKRNGIMGAESKNEFLAGQAVQAFLCFFNGSIGGVDCFCRSDMDDVRTVIERNVSFA